MIQTRSLIRTRNRARKATEQRSDMATWKVARPSGEGAFNPDTGAWTPPATVPVYEGPGFMETQVSTNAVPKGDAVRMVEVHWLRFAADQMPALKRGDICTPVSPDDIQLSGRSWLIIELPADSYAIHRKYQVEEVTLA